MQTLSRDQLARYGIIAMPKEKKFDWGKFLGVVLVVWVAFVVIFNVLRCLCKTI